MTISFIACLGLFILIGVASFMQSRGSKHDYYLASSSVSPWLVGLSAVATNNSGYMFIGVIGYTYANGLSTIWMMIGWIIGDFIGAMVVQRQLHAATVRTGSVSYPGVLAHWLGHANWPLRRLIAVLAALLLMSYAAAQLLAGGKALQALFDWPPSTGAFIGAIMVAIYCLAGGIRASIWTDAAQSFVMVGAMGLMLVVAVVNLGGVGGAVHEMEQVDGFLNWLPQDLAFPGLAGGALFIIGWLFAGMSVIGQPHVMVRFMTLGDNKQFFRARAWYYVWFTIFYLMATGVGMLSRIYLSDTGGNFDAELALPSMAKELLPPALVGLVLAGIFAATMSTADSVLLSCSAAMTADLPKHPVNNPWLIRGATMLATVLALMWALSSKDSVFSLVLFAWSTLASAFAPLLLVLAFKGRPNQALAMLMVVLGAATAVGWRLLGWNAWAYEGMPGILMGLIVYLIGRPWLSLDKNDVPEQLLREDEQTNLATELTGH